jgi:hypothetical protein
LVFFTVSAIQISFAGLDPNRQKRTERENYDYGLMARLKPGLSFTQVQIDVDRVIASIQPRYTAIANLHLHTYFRTLKEETVRDARPFLNMLLGAVGPDHADCLRESYESPAGTRDKP